MRLTEAERLRWVDHAGARVDPYRDRPIEEITLDDHGRLRVESMVSCGVYVVVNSDDDVMYIGKVRREFGTIADRFRNHHAACDEWDRVWILPFHEDADPCSIESAMIKHFRPPDNVRGMT